MSNKQALNKSMDKAKIKLLMMPNTVFITSVLFKLLIKWTDVLPGGEKCDTAAVDGKTIFINPDFWLSLSVPVQIAVLCHETWHVCFNHMFRCQIGDFNPKKHNRAADYVINIMLKDNGFAVQSDWLCDPQFRGMDTTTVYNLLPDKPDDNKPGGQGGMGSDIMPAPNSPEGEKIQRDVEDILIQAAMQSKMESEDAGTIPGDIQIEIDKLLNPKLDWKTILQNYFSAFAKNDYTFKRPNKRFQPDFYLPSLHSECLGEIAIAVDTSGSVSDDVFRVFLTEINDIKEKLNPLLTTIIDFDTSISHIHKVGPDETIRKLPFSGRGGTDLQPVFDYYEKTHPTVLIIFSDLWCGQIEDDPGYPVVWICTDNENAEVNFGKLIHYDTTEAMA
jgi:predicted metal-dependent peptidase